MNSTLFNGLRQGHVAASDWPRPGACATRADSASEIQERRREKSLEIMDDMWQILIGCLNFYHLNNFNSIISLEINFDTVNQLKSLN